MTDDQVGKYTKLLCHCWIENGLKIGSPLVEQWFNQHPILARCFFKKGGKYRNPRLDRERKKQMAWAEKSKKGGLKSAEKRGNPNHPSTKAQPRGKQRPTKGQLFSLYSLSLNKDKSRDLSLPPNSKKEDVELTQALINGILDNNSGASVIKRMTEKGAADWLDQCRLLRERDNRTPEEILAVIQFSQADKFWKGNILSMPTLREKWDQLFLKAKAAGRGSGGYVRDEGARYVKLTPAEEAEEEKLRTEYKAELNKFLKERGYKSDEEMSFDELTSWSFERFKAQKKKEGKKP